MPRAREVAASVTLRPYTSADEDAAIELWRRTWAQHYPHIDFNARVAWWRERWRQELVPVAHIVMAERDGALAGFVTVDPKTMYLDQIVVAPEHWGAGVALALLNDAKHLSPQGLDLLVNKDNARAISFYTRHGFVYAGEDKNPVSGIAVNRMKWRPFDVVPINFQLTATAELKIKEMTSELNSEQGGDFVPSLHWHEEYEEVEHRLVDRGFVVGWFERGRIPKNAIQTVGGLEIVFAVTQNQSVKFKGRTIDWVRDRFMFVQL